MTTLFFSHPSSLEHDTGPGHPERSDRIRAIERAIEAERFNKLLRRLSPGHNREAILRVHPQPYVEAIETAAPKEGRIHLDPDTVMSPGTMEAIAFGVGAVVAAVDAVIAGEATNAFVATRPPGHHAERSQAMGFCFFNNAAIAARHAQAAHDLERIAIVDFDVHHGNGTQDIFWSDASVLYASTHQMPLFPGSGAASQCGDHDNIVNAPLRAGDGGDAFRSAMESVILPRIDAFAPDLIVISAGFDAHRHDPLAQLKLVEEDFVWVTERLMDVAQRRARSRVVSVLEGGYNLDALAPSAAAHIGALMEA
ncbi:histone deacetylase family protein [Methylocapsa palsarum]|uniref:Acetoin utilization deacetylase AcuC n=1 Tax=Methylocapsa palsarum TaxID=1612308 RepID=A0A1I3X2Y7_9HYPH|nr:histone deacetylase family protein [Methylocapsa palsarum]SFK14162.1 Acetoin utilization deacetylase AcuC [Methylocapsa palsarum]